MPKGVAVKRDNIPPPDSKKASEIDTLSKVDQGKDFVKVNEN